MPDQQDPEELVLVELYVSKVVPKKFIEDAKEALAELIAHEGDNLIQEWHGHSPYGEPLTRDMVDERYQELSEKDLAEGLDEEVDCA